MAKKPFLKLRRLYEDQGLLQKELSELSDIPLDTLKGRLNAPEDKGRWKACEIVKAATSWADKSRMKATPGCRFLLMANGTLSSDGHWTTADPQSIVFRR